MVGLHVPFPSFNSHQLRASLVFSLLPPVPSVLSCWEAKLSRSISSMSISLCVAQGSWLFGSKIISKPIRATAPGPAASESDGDGCHQRKGRLLWVLRLRSHGVQSWDNTGSSSPEAQDILLIAPLRRALTLRSSQGMSRPGLAACLRTVFRMNYGSFMTLPWFLALAACWVQASSGSFI